MNKLILFLLPFISIPALASLSEGEEEGQGDEILTRSRARHPKAKGGEMGESTEMLQLKIKRIYQEADEKDGMRVLIDGLWPRGIKKADAKIDLWLKEIAPSSELRKWFSHDPEKWPEFHERYYKELSLKQEPVRKILDIFKEHHTVTLIYSSKEERYNNAVALKEYLERHIHQSHQSRK